MQVHLQVAIVRNTELISVPEICRQKALFFFCMTQILSKINIKSIFKLKYWSHHCVTDSGNTDGQKSPLPIIYHIITSKVCCWVYLSFLGVFILSERETSKDWEQQINQMKQTFEKQLQSERTLKTQVKTEANHTTCLVCYSILFCLK